MAESDGRDEAPGRAGTLIFLTDDYLFISRKALRWLLILAAGAFGGPKVIDFIKAIEEIARL